MCGICRCAGTAVSSGIVVPMLLLGSCIGRIVGLGMVDIFGAHPETAWAWIDEGAMALIGVFFSFFQIFCISRMDGNMRKAFLDKCRWMILIEQTNILSTFSIDKICCRLLLSSLVYRA